MCHSTDSIQTQRDRQQKIRRYIKACSISLERENTASEADNIQGNENLVYFPNNDNVSETQSSKTQLTEPLTSDKDFEIL